MRVSRSLLVVALLVPAAPALADPVPSKDPPRQSAGPPARPAAGADKSVFRQIAEREAKLAGLPSSLVDAVIKIESDYRPDRIGDVGEIGLMQVRPSTAAVMGFRGTPGELADPATNIHYGAAYLGAAWRLAKGNVCRTLMKYRAGHGNETMTPLSVTYCERARLHLASVGSPLAATITPADLVAVAGAAVRSAEAAPARRPEGPGAVLPGESLKANGRFKKGPAFWAAFEARVRRINAGVEAKWRRMASR